MSKNRDGTLGTYQTVGVFRAGASSGTLLVAAVIGQEAFAPLAARRTVTAGHFNRKRQVQSFSCSLTDWSYCPQATDTHRSGSPAQLLPSSLSNTARNSWGLHQQNSTTNKAAVTHPEVSRFQKSKQSMSGSEK